MTYLGHVKAPPLAPQGESDIRAPAEEARQVVESLKKNGDAVGAYFYPEEGHGFSKPDSQKDALQRTIDWFDN